MTFFRSPRKSQVLSSQVQASFIDILYDHENYLRQNNGQISKPISNTNKKVAIIGAGAAGLVSAYQLKKVGLTVDLYEAEQRYGGRVFSYHPIEKEAALFEMGAMRVPPSEKIFNFYAKEFGMESGDFPDPGKVPTSIIFEGELYQWQPNDENPPEIFKLVSESWENFTKTLNPLVKLLKDGSPESFSSALTQWQKMINPIDKDNMVSYSHISFFEGLVHLFVDNYTLYGLEKPWAEKEFQLFGSLGLGSGGFGPLYQVNFAEIVRLVVNGLEDDQKFYPCGLDQLVHGFAETDTGNGKVSECIHYGEKITKVMTTDDGQVRLYKGSSNAYSCYDAVIIATTNRSMEVDIGITLPSKQENAKPLFQNSTYKTSIRQLHLMNSSKLFVLTKSKFWKKDKKFPANIETDGLVRGLYCLDYPDTDKGVVLVSYTWGDDSTKYIAVKDPNERLELLLRSLEPYVPEFANKLKDEILYQHTKLIDWQDQKHYYGGFKLNYPGQDYYNQCLYYQFSSSENGIYLAGDSISWSGGWIEGALQTGMNAACAVINQFSPSSLFPENPMVQRQQADQYNYDISPE